MNKMFEKGQSMVEMAFVIIIFIIVMVGFIDVAPLAGNFYIAKQMSARGARAASVYLKDGVRTCRQDVLNAIGDPWLLNASWEVEIDEWCDNDPNTKLTTGTPINVKISVDYKPLFLGGFGWPAKDTASSWPFSISTTDQAR
jgi:hypothetical protein